MIEKRQAEVPPNEAPRSRDDLSRDDVAEMYLEQLPFEPYPFQEEAILAWFSSDQGVLVCAPTGMGKTLIAEAALFEALHTGRRAYYTTPLIALTEQKFRELQQRAVAWGMAPTDVGLVTGNRRENPDARILVVVAEILFNRLVHGDEFSFDDVTAVVMDEFHSFGDPERGIVWEFSLGLLPRHVRTLLISATVGNPYEFVSWLRNHHDRRLELVQSDQRKVPLTFAWVGDQLLPEQLERMTQGTEDQRTTPALVFCFNRDACWNVAEQIKGKAIIDSARQKTLAEAIQEHDWSKGAGPKLKQMLLRGVGVHHAGVLPKYRRIVEELFQQKLLSIAVCTETLAAGINLPARSVVLPSLMKGPAGKRRIIEPASAHQIFGRAGRPQFDTQGYVFVLAHEDDVKIARWKEKFDQIPEDTKDPKLLQAKKRMKKKMPKRKTGEQYWTEEQFIKLRELPPANLVSRGPLPWRLLAYMLDASPEVKPIRDLVARRLTDERHTRRSQQDLDEMLLTLWRAGYVTLEPSPLEFGLAGAPDRETAAPDARKTAATEDASEEDDDDDTFGAGIFDDLVDSSEEATSGGDRRSDASGPTSPEEEAPYRAEQAHPTERLPLLMKLRGVNPLYGVFLVNQLGIADRDERIQAFESVLELPRSVGRYVRVPRQSDLPPGPLATTRLDVQLLQLGLATPEELVEPSAEELEERREAFGPTEYIHVLTLADKLKRLFDYDFPKVRDVRVHPVWAAGEILRFNGDFNKYVTSHQLQKQEGVIFRHLLRLILLIREFVPLCPPDAEPTEWGAELSEIADTLASACHRVDPMSTHEALAEVEQQGDS